MARVSLYISSIVIIYFTTVILSGLFFYKVNPANANTWQFILLYSFIFIGVSSFFSLVGFMVRAFLWSKGSKFLFLRVSTRQGIFLGFFTVITLILQGIGILNLWTGVLLLTIFILIELYSQ